jgi:hypothetical protein
MVGASALTFSFFYIYLSFIFFIMKTITELVSMEERRWIAKHAVVEIGSEVKYKVIDINKAVERIREQRKSNNMTPYVIIEAINPQMQKTYNRMPTFQKDPVTDVLYGILTGQDSFGNPKWMKPQLQESLSLNLDLVNDAKLWAVLRFNSNIQGSPFQTENPFFKVMDPMAAARIENDEVKQMKLAFERVDILLKDPKSMVMFARYMGIDFVESSNFEIVESELLKKARLKPSFFNANWDRKGRAYIELYKSALALGVIRNELDKGYYYKDIRLGVTEEEAIRTISKDNNISSAINNTIMDEDKVISNVKLTINKNSANLADINGEDFE